jgi:hypothetical protein
MYAAPASLTETSTGAKAWIAMVTPSADAPAHVIRPVPRRAPSPWRPLWYTDRAARSTVLGSWPYRRS